MRSPFNAELHESRWEITVAASSLNDQLAVLGITGDSKGLILQGILNKGQYQTNSLTGHKLDAFISRSDNSAMLAKAIVRR